jgi:hypothetical protein
MEKHQSLNRNDDATDSSARAAAKKDLAANRSGRFARE